MREDMDRAPRSSSRRILITGLATFWGGRLALHLEKLPHVEGVVGLDTKEPTVPLERTEFVKADTGYSAVQRIVLATQVDTILHTHLMADPTLAPHPPVHEINVNVLGGELVTPLTRVFAAPLVPTILGFDPQLQFVHTEDVVAALEFCVDHDAPGIYNVAGDGSVPWSEVLSRLRKPPLQLPPVATGVAAALLRPLGLDIPAELQDLLRYGRSVDNRRLKFAGFRYHYTSAAALLAHVEEMRLHRTKGPEPGHRDRGRAGGVPPPAPPGGAGRGEAKPPPPGPSRPPPGPIPAPPGPGRVSPPHG